MPASRRAAGPAGRLPRAPPSGPGPLRALTAPCRPTGADHHTVHRLPGPHLLLLLRVPGREGRRGRVGPRGVRQLRRRPVVGCGTSGSGGPPRAGAADPGQRGAGRHAAGPHDFTPRGWDPPAQSRRCPARHTRGEDGARARPLHPHLPPPECAGLRGAGAPGGSRTEPGAGGRATAGVRWPHYEWEPLELRGSLLICGPAWARARRGPEPGRGGAQACLPPRPLSLLQKGAPAQLAGGGGSGPWLRTGSCPFCFWVPTGEARPARRALDAGGVSVFSKVPGKPGPHQPSSRAGEGLGSDPLLPPRARLCPGVAGPRTCVCGGAKPPQGASRPTTGRGDASCDRLPGARRVRRRPGARGRRAVAQPMSRARPRCAPPASPAAPGAVGSEAAPPRPRHGGTPTPTPVQTSARRPGKRPLCA